MASGPAYYDRFSGLYAMHLAVPPFSTWVARNHASIRRALPRLEPGSPILEIGAGIGRFSRALAQRYPRCPVTCIDSSPDMTARALADVVPDNLSFVTRSFWEADGRYALVICAGCWEFFEREPSADQLVRLLAPGGTAVINTLAPAPFSRVREGLFRKLWGTRMWLHEPADLAEALRARGCLVRWEPVNRAEGAYTLTAIRGG